MFGGSIADLKPAHYSFGWGGSVVGEHTIKTAKHFATAESVPDFMAKVESMADKDGGYKGMAANIIAGDRFGNIGYQMALPMYRRKNETPYLGCHVLDGTTSEFDWTDELVPLKELPRSLNPSRGYIANANNR